MPDYLPNHVPVAAPVDTDSAGRGGAEAINAVMRVVCPQIGSQGTGFLHSSGMVITAEHVVRGCADAILWLSSGTQMAAKVLAVDPVLDLAILEPVAPIAVQPLKLSVATDISIGAQVSTWGYPGGFMGAAPMLSAGYVGSVVGEVHAGQVVQRIVVNAAFNSGNSGGPLLLVETGEVVGVVVSKLAPISQKGRMILSTLAANRSGFQYTLTDPAGNRTSVSEGQLVAEFLEELRGQVQLVIGYAATGPDLASFLTKHGQTP